MAVSPTLRKPDLIVGFAAPLIAFLLGAATAVFTTSEREFLVPAIVFGAVICVTSVFRPLTGLALIFVWLNSPLTRLLAPDIGSVISYLPTGLMGLLLLAVAVMSDIRSGSVFGSRLDLAIVGLTAFDILGTLVGLVNGNDAVLLMKDASQVTEFVVYYFIVSRIVTTRSQMRTLLWIMIGSSVATALFDITLFSLGQGTNAVAIAGIEFPRVINNFTGMLPALFVANLLISRERIVSSMIGLVCSGVALTLSFTRSLWLGAVVSVVVVLVFFIRPRRLAPRQVLGLGGLLVGVAFALLVAQLIIGQPILELTIKRVGQAVEQLTRPDNPIAARRQDETVAALDAVSQSPLLGIGFGGTYLGPNGATLAELETGDRHFIHNLFIGIMLRTGVVGLVLFLFAALIGGRYLVWQFRTTNDLMYRVLCAGTVATLVGGMFVSITADALFRHPFAAVYGGILGLCASRAIIATEDPKLGVLASSPGTTSLEPVRCRLAAET